MRDRYEDDDDLAEDEREATPNPGWRARVGQRVSVLTGAALALAIIIGAGLWGYRLTQRDAMAIPVIRAATGQAKVQPTDSGPSATGQEDIASYNAGEAAPKGPVDITFAPPSERPAAEDVAMGNLAGQSGGAGPTEPAPAADGAEARDPAEAEAELAAYAPPESPMAPRRPGNLSDRVAAARSAASEQQKLAARAAASQVQIQLGFFPTRDETEEQWLRIYSENEDILQNRALVIQDTISGGRRIFRLRAGPFEDQIEARGVCRALTSRGQDCLVAVNR